MTYRAVCFDIDGTIVEPVSSWRYIHERLGKWDVLAYRYQESFRAGQITYREFCELDAMHWRGLREDAVAAMFDDIPYVRNVERAMAALKEMGLKLIALSTGLQFMAERVSRELEFDVVLFNRLKAHNGVLSGEVEINISHGGKGEALVGILRGLGIGPKNVIAVGDSEGDIPMMELAGYSIAFNSSSEALSARADYECRTGDFKEIADHIRGLLRKGEP